MRIQIVKETFADENFRFYLKQKLPLGWTKIRLPWPCESEVEYHKSLEAAMTRLQGLLKEDLAATVVDVQVVYDTGEPK